MEASKLERLIGHARHLLPTLKRSAERLTAKAPPRDDGGDESVLDVIDEEPGDGGGSGAAPPAHTPVSKAELEETQRRRQETLLGAGAVAVEKLAQKGQDVQLDDDEQEGLEAIVVLSGRPAIRIQNGTFVTPDEPWNDLEGFKPKIVERARSVGRIEIQGNPLVPFGGTGFVVAPGIIMTNRHVASIFAKRSAGGWGFLDWMKAGINFVEDPGRGWPVTYNVVEIIGVHDTIDMALLRIAPVSDGALPVPLQLEANPPEDLTHRRVYTIGYPARDVTRNDPGAVQQIFGGVFNVKRLGPGEVMTVLPDLPQVRHDCSTLGGNSGSAVFDLATHRVLGLHFNGKYLQFNTAVALWKLAVDPLIKKADVQFA